MNELGNPEAGASPCRREGFSLVEVVVSMVILAVVVTSLGAVSAVTAQRSLVLANSTTRTAFTLQETNRLAAIPYASLPAAVGCDTLVSGNLRYERCITVTNSTRYRTVQIVVRPLRTAVGVWSDTITIRRAVEITSNPLFTP
jgi:prepilin-type N-terminal cleavage/methylation domain-containing protein